jgi:hypothetical protein
VGMKRHRPRSEARRARMARDDHDQWSGVSGGQSSWWQGRFAGMPECLIETGEGNGSAGVAEDEGAVRSIGMRGQVGPELVGADSTPRGV